MSTGIGAALLSNGQEIKETEGMTLLPIEDLVKHIGLAYKANKENTPLIVAVKAVYENRLY